MLSPPRHGGRREKNFCLSVSPDKQKYFRPSFGVVCGQRRENLWKIGLSRFSIKVSFSVSSVSRRSPILLGRVGGKNDSQWYLFIAFGNHCIHNQRDLMEYLKLIAHSQKDNTSTIGWVFIGSCQIGSVGARNCWDKLVTVQLGIFIPEFFIGISQRE